MWWRKTKRLDEGEAVKRKWGNDRTRERLLNESRGEIRKMSLIRKKQSGKENRNCREVVGNLLGIEIKSYM